MKTVDSRDYVPNSVLGFGFASDSSVQFLNAGQVVSMSKVKTIKSRYPALGSF